MYREAAKLILYRDLGEDSILLKLAKIFEDFEICDVFEIFEALDTFEVFDICEETDWLSS